MRNSARPRYETKPTRGSRLNQVPILRAAKSLGFTPMPWQRKPIRLLGELRDPTEEELDQFGPVVAGGIPRYRQVLATVPRQSGKSTVAQAFVKAKAEQADGQRVYGTSKTRDDARLWQAELALLLPDVHYTTAAGRETITWSNGSTYSIFAPNKKGGHGASANGVLIDEAWTLLPEVLQGIIPAMAAQPLAQLLVVTSMGDLESRVWNGLVAMGREAVSDPDATVGYIEYSAEKAEDVFDPDKWGEWMPALGLTQSRESIRADMALMEADPDEGPTGVVRAYGNITTASRVRLFPEIWVSDAWAVIEPPQRFILAVDVNDDPSGSAVTTGHVTESGVVALRSIEHRVGSPAWVPGFVESVVTGRKVDAVVIDPGAPTRQIRAELDVLCTRLGIPLVERTARDVAADVLGFYNALKDQRVVMVKTEPLEAAMEGAAKRDHGDLWYISRARMSVDASPLISGILAYGTAAELAVRPVVEWNVW